jgi:SAM-dependent methyltransferase
MEFGFGNGYFLDFLGDCYRRVSGCEVSKTAIRAAKKKHGFKKKIVRYKKYGIPFHRNSFDIIFCIKSLSAVGIDSLDNVLLELRRILKKKGYIFIVDFLHQNEKNDTNFFNFKDQVIHTVNPDWIDRPLFHFTIENLESLLNGQAVAKEKILLESYNGNIYPGFILLLKVN